MRPARREIRVTRETKADLKATIDVLEKSAIRNNALRAQAETDLLEERALARKLNAELQVALSELTHARAELRFIHEHATAKTIGARRTFNGRPVIDQCATTDATLER